MIKLKKTNLQAEKIRYALLDELRGFLVFCMVFYHGFFSVYDVFNLKFSADLFDFFSPVQPFFAGCFIFLSGLMCGFSHSNTKRGLITCAIALLVTASTVLASEILDTSLSIYFGILHLLGISMLFCGLLDPLLRRMNRFIGLFLNLLLFVGLYGVSDNNYNLFHIQKFIPAAWHKIPWLFPFGITTNDFYSADYFPLIPWIFLFIAGYYAVKLGFIERAEHIFRPSRCRPLAFLGRHALLIYILHQPVIYGACYILMLTMSHSGGA